MIINCYLFFEANLNGEYFAEDSYNGYYLGIIKEFRPGDTSPRYAKMMVSPTNIIKG